MACVCLWRKESVFNIFLMQLRCLVVAFDFHLKKVMTTQINL